VSKLVRCPDCATEVSRKATACPKCGRRFPQFIGPATRVVLLLLLLVWVILSADALYRLADSETERGFAIGDAQQSADAGQRSNGQR
jgi:hypothetical protein